MDEMSDVLRPNPGRDKGQNGRVKGDILGGAKSWEGGCVIYIPAAAEDPRPFSATPAGGWVAHGPDPGDHDQRPARRS